MIALFDSPPSYCPQCGAQVQMPPSHRQDFLAGAAMVCWACPFQYGFSGQIAQLAITTNGAYADWRDYLPSHWQGRA